MDDEEEFLFQSSVSTVPHEQLTTTSSSVNTEVISNENSSKSSQKEVISNEGGNVPSSYVQKNHPSSSIIGDPSFGIITKKKDKIDYAKLIANICYTSSIEPTSVD
ncbi:putative mitochondrial protein [Cucumis melo var. makuwa]|uniref:Mitochondrial protein n=1 Tax=Cucumis melo var. makuwa TaxID=1194695 RepID=A0A5A7T028_CUCMM|nr:putative mitochondrial protein [Cucumis melo var. makuwa]